MHGDKPKTSFNRDYLFLGIIIFAGIFLRIAVISFYDHFPESDEVAYKTMAIHAAAGSPIMDQFRNYATYNVGYPLFLTPVFFFLGENLLAVKLMNVFLGVLTMILAYFVAKEAGAGRFGRLFAAAVWAVYLPASVYTVYLAKENLMQPLMLAVLWCALRFLDGKSYKIAILCGLLFGLLALTGNAAMTLFGAVIVALLLAPITLKRKAGSFLLITAFTLLVSAPWMIRNAHILGSPVLNTNGGFNLYLGNNPAATGFFVLITDTPRGETWEDLRKEGEIHASETLKKEAVAWIQSHPGEFFILAVKKAVYFWMPPFHEGEDSPSRVQSVLRTLWAVQFLILIAAAAGCLTRSELRNKRLLILWTAIFCYTAVHMLFYVIFRYREAIMPVLGILAACYLESVISAYFKKRRESKIA